MRGAPVPGQGLTIKKRSLSIENNNLPAKLHPKLQEIFAARGVAGPDQLNYRLDALLPNSTLGGLARAAELLADAVIHQQRILVVGDFDADGATGSALALRVLRAMGATSVEFCVPDRFRFGYGLTADLARSFAGSRPDLVMTVDNGVSSIEGVSRTRQQGARVIVTDHHLPGPELPAADALVNPNLPDDPFPSKALAGVGVVFYVMAAVRRRLDRMGRAVRLSDWLDLVALGTVADLVPLDHNNRVLVAQGLARIRRGQGNPGIRALMDVAGRDLGRVSAADLGFAVAPRLNAAGRLEDMGVGIQCLLTDDYPQARELAAELDRLNRERRQLQSDMEEQAHDIVASLRQRAYWGQGTSLCLFDPGWHQGVVGLVASRMKDACHRPVIALAPAGDGSSLLKGSARSIRGFHIRDALAEVDALHPGLMCSFGGHAMAAGLSLERDHVERFAQAFEAAAARCLDPEQLGQVVFTDGGLDPDQIGIILADLIAESGPWGQGFPEPLFDDCFDVDDLRPVGHGHTRLQLIHQAGGRPVEAIAFGMDSERVESMGPSLRVLYHLGVNEYRGLRKAQLVVQHLLPA